jgi:cell wall-associated NlpC family hydrolase
VKNLLFLRYILVLNVLFLLIIPLSFSTQPTIAASDDVCWRFEMAVRNNDTITHTGSVRFHNPSTFQVYGEAFITLNPGEAGTLRLAAFVPAGIIPLLGGSVLGLDFDPYTLEPTDSSACNSGGSTLGEKAAALALQVLGTPYHSQAGDLTAKGWKKDHWESPDEVKASAGIDCSGLIEWAYNRAAGSTQYEEAPNSLKNMTNPILYPGVDGQYRFNFLVSENPDGLPGSLQPGDVIFEDYPVGGSKDHIGMFVGNQGGSAWVVHSPHPGATVEKVKLSDVQNSWPGNLSYGRLTQPTVNGKLVSHSPITLVVTDPDGSQLRQIPYSRPLKNPYAKFQALCIIRNGTSTATGKMRIW